ncbi:YjcZ family sporulation protein [Bacillus sp. V2I10]|uniref:YjcZ family sporulation protein n=1 Tax=Bacillus sp. V2I10 TaxID=3042276 RepID=UPI0027D8F361|nr:YjcZ family sporulation protein [Bacillus sp. V2I10]
MKWIITGLYKRREDVKMYNNVNAPFTSGENIPHSPALSHGYIAPAYGYAAPVCVYRDHRHGCHDFAIIVVLFILLIIIGACTFCG